LRRKQVCGAGIAFNGKSIERAQVFLYNLSEFQVPAITPDTLLDRWENEREAMIVLTTADVTVAWRRPRLPGGACFMSSTGNALTLTTNFRYSINDTKSIR
jgi:hypothetical protein